MTLTEKWGLLAFGTIISVASATVETIARSWYMTKSYCGGANDRENHPQLY